jgi:hypothetical protein
LEEIAAKAAGNNVRLAEIKKELQELLIATMNLRRTILTAHFIATIAKNLKQRDPTFTKDEAIAFILRVFVDGSVQGKGQRLTEDKRQEYYRRLDEEIFHCHHTGLPVHFFVSQLFEMASPDRYDCFTWK